MPDVLARRKLKQTSSDQDLPWYHHHETSAQRDTKTCLPVAVRAENSFKLCCLINQRWLNYPHCWIISLLPDTEWNWFDFYAVHLTVTQLGNNGVRMYYYPLQVPLLVKQNNHACAHTQWPAPFCEALILRTGRTAAAWKSAGEKKQRPEPAVRLNYTQLCWWEEATGAVNKALVTTSSLIVRQMDNPATFSTKNGTRSVH